ncbi:MAG: hypothetical protein NC251_13455 [Lachnoclostridium sp.]|nr:hypothetical protein [Lachnospira sp.]MCM1249417.1 hypothetical protein [Lachnoclostridium sp.]
MQGKLVGFKRFKSKKGNDLCLANIETPFSPSDIARGCVGSDVQGVFVPDDQYDLLTEKDIGKTVELVYSINNGRAYLEELRMLK